MSIARIPVFLFAAYLLCCTHTSYAQIKEKQFVLHVSIIGESEKKTLVCADSAAAILALTREVEVMRENGFLNAGTDSIIVDSLSLSALVYKGHCYFWETVRIAGDDKLVSQRLRRKIDKLAGRKISVSQLADLKEEIVTEYENQGYPFAKLLTDSVLTDTGKISLVLQIDPRHRVVFDSIIVVGGLRIHPSYLKGFTRIAKGNPYDERKLAVIARLRNVPFITLNGAPKVNFIENRAHVIISAGSAKSNRFSGILGLLPDNSRPGKLLVSGDAEIELHNSFKRGEFFSFNWRKPGGPGQDLQVKAEYPFIRGLSIGLSAEFNLFRKDTSYLQAGWKAGLPFYFSGNNSLEVFYESQSSSLLSVYGFENLTVLPENLDMSSGLTGLALFYKNTDNLYNPSREFNIRFKSAYGMRTITRNAAVPAHLYDNLEEKSQKTCVQNDASVFYPVAGKFVLRYRNQAGAVFASQIFDNELYRLGGMKTIRGFDEESLLAEKYLVNTLEVRYLFESLSCLYLFADWAFIEYRNTTDSPLGLGLGLSFSTRAGIFTVNYAIGRQQGNDFQFRSAKIHFGLINRF
jgi:outer membrane protein assembly factor BamA